MSFPIVFAILVSSLSLFCLYVNPVEGILCYECSSVPSAVLYREGCDSLEGMNNTDHLIVDCAKVATPYHKGAPDPFLNYVYESSSALNHSLAPKGVTLDWICLKGVALVNNKIYVTRGCIYALTDSMANRCEEISNDYVLDNITITKGEMCFCNTDKCNAANVRSLTNPFLSTLMLLLLSLTAYK